MSLKRTIVMLAAAVLVASVGFGPAWSCDKDKKAEATAAANHEKAGCAKGAALTADSKAGEAHAGCAKGAAEAHTGCAKGAAGCPKKVAQAAAIAKTDKKDEAKEVAQNPAGSTD